MKIWSVHPESDKYKGLMFLSDNDRKSMDLIDGKALLNIWGGLNAEFENRRRPIADFSDLYPGILVLNDKAVNKLEKYFENTVEYLALNVKNSPVKFTMVNIINVIDCLDYEKSIFSRYPDDGQIFHCRKYVFQESLVGKQHLFKAPEFARAVLFASDAFKQTVEEEGLTGFVFKLVWDSEEISEPEEEEILIESPNQESLQVPVETVKVIYLVITKKEAKALKSKIEKHILVVIIDFVKQEKQVDRKLDCLGLEFFFDGQHADINIRVTNRLDNGEYIDSDFQCLTHEFIENDFKTLYHHFVKDEENDDETDAFAMILEEMILNLHNEMLAIDWSSISPLTTEFSIEEPENFD